jgi:hypothetical protein
MNEKETNALVDTLEAVMRDVLCNGGHPTVAEVTPIPGGLTEIGGTFNLSIVARSCLQAIERAGYKLTR